MTRSTRSNSSPATNREYRESSVISINSDGESQDTNQDAPYELDSEYTVPSDHTLGPVADYLKKEKQRAQNNEGAEDGDDEHGEDYEDEDEDEDMFDGDYIIEEDNNEPGDDENGAATQEEVKEWARIQLEKLDTDIEATNNKIKDLDEKKKKAETRAADSRTRYRLEFATKKMGAHQLEKIRKQQTDAEQSIQKTNGELAKAQEKLTDLEGQRDDMEFDTVRKYNEALEKHRPRKPRKGNRHFPPEHNLDSGDDSLSDALRKQEEKENKKRKTTKEKTGRACRRCKLRKTGCEFQPGNASCDLCAVTGERCRYKENFSGDKQIRPWLIHDKLDQVAVLKAELSNFRDKSAVSLGAENPLSGITGYGPSTQKWARQNWALMVRGHPPRPPLPTPSQGDHSSSISVKRKSPTEPKDVEPSQPVKRQRQTESNTPKQYSFQNETAETFGGPSKRGRKPGQTSSTRTTRRPQTAPTTPPEEQNQQNDPPAYPFTFEYPVPRADLSTNPTHPPTVDRPQINAVSASNTKLWWAQMISDRGGELPVNVLFMPGWPRWADHMNEKQEIWFNTLYSAGVQVPLVEEKSIEDDGGVEPLWPSWTRVTEALNQNQKDHLTRVVQGEFDIRELHDQDGIAQGTVDWQFAESQVQSQASSSPASR